MIFRSICFLLFIGLIQATILVLRSNDTYLDRIAMFGPRFESGLTGNLSISSSRFGCEPLTDPPPSTDWIALVERGHCSFADKVRAMQASQAKAVVIGDPHFNGWITMYATGNISDILIPSVYVAQSQFRALQLHSKEHPALIQLLRDEDAAWSFTDMMIVIILSPSVMILVVYFTWKCREYHRRLGDLAPCHVVASLPSRIYRREKQATGLPSSSSSTPPPPLPMTSTTFHYTTYLHDDKSLNHFNNDDECAICLEQYLDDDRIRTLPCQHEFHAACIDTWLTTRKKFCPICKYNICQGKPQMRKGRHQQQREEHQRHGHQEEQQQQSQWQYEEDCNPDQPLPSHINEQTPLLPC